MHKRFQKNKKIIDSNRVFVKPNFTWDPGITPLPHEQRKGFLFVGRLEKIKGIDIVLRTWAMMQKKNLRKAKVSTADEDVAAHNGQCWKMPHLTVCGTGPLEEECKKYVEQNHLTDVVEFTGSISHEEVMRRMSEAKALIFPSRWYEGFPMTIVEAMSVGMPVICSDIGNGGCIIRTTQGGVTFKRDSIHHLESVVNHIHYAGSRSEMRREEAFMSECNYGKLFQIYQLI